MVGRSRQDCHGWSSLGDLKSGMKVCHLHGFNDANEKAYCCAFYLHIVTGDSQKVTLLTSKTRVSLLEPIDYTSIEKHYLIAVYSLIVISFTRWLYVWLCFTGCLFLLF